MQQPGLQQVPAGWPGMPGLQAPLSAQATPFTPSSSQPFSPGQSPFPSSGQSPFPAPAASSPSPQALLAQPPLQTPPQSYTVYPQSYSPQQSTTLPPMPAYQPPFPHQLQGQFQAQAQPAPQPQAPPVSPVSFPSSPYGSAQPQGQQAPPNPAQLMMQQLVEMAKSLEQLVPGYQTVLSLLFELNSSSSPSTADALSTIEDCLYYHGASLGAIRRLLCGEATPAVLTNLASAFHGLSQVQPRLGPAVDRVLSLLPNSQQSPAATLVQTLDTAEGQLSQVGAAIQRFVGPQIWESSRSQVRRRTTGKQAAKP